MRDIWAFLLQTLTASGAALLLLVVKAMFRDKLSPRWQFAVWGVLGLVLLIPAGLFGRYALVNWPLLIESLKTTLTGSYTLTGIVAPFPLPVASAPETVFDWLFLVYTAGVVVMLLRCLLTYLRLRLVLGKGTAADARNSDRVRAVADQYALPTCALVEAPGLSSAFLCGVLRPVLVIPAREAMDEKVILHELLHLKHRDVIWGLVIGLMRCIHWCNPLLWYCADRAGNDLEALCDQRVLERLEGEARREYGRILLSMSNDRYAHVPGTSSMANGGKNIRRRIEAIARFKRYPSGMKLVSFCVAILLAAPLLLGTQAAGVYQAEGNFPAALDLNIAFASARTLRCTTPAGALDAYAKALITQNGAYRAMCAPVAEHEALARRARDAQSTEHRLFWDTGLPCRIKADSGYAIYNLEPTGRNTYECLVVAVLQDYPHRQVSEKNWNYVAAQAVRVEKEGGRWIVLPQDDFRVVEILGDPWLTWGIEQLPAYVFADTASGFRAELHLQKVFTVDNTIQDPNSHWLFAAAPRYDTVPKPNAVFDEVHWNSFVRCVYVGDDAQKAAISAVGLSIAPLDENGTRPKLQQVNPNEAGSSSNGAQWGGANLVGDWERVVTIGSGGTIRDFDADSFTLPDGYAGMLYLNWQSTCELTLLPEKGGAA